MLKLTVTASGKDVESLACALRAIVDLISVDYTTGSFGTAIDVVTFTLTDVTAPDTEYDVVPSRPEDQEF